MTEVIYICQQGRYPFGRGKQSKKTFLKYMIEAKDDNEINRYRQLNSILKKLDFSNIIRLEKVLKQQNKFHMIYQYHDKSLGERLKELQRQEQLVGIFVQLEHVFETLIHGKLKAQLYLQLMGVDQHNHLKVWIRPDQTQFLGNTQQSDKKTQRCLVGFYETQRTRIHLQIEQIIQAQELLSLKKGAITKQQRSTINTCQTAGIKAKAPNFVIEGNMLVFLSPSSQKGKNFPNQASQQNCKQKRLQSKANHLVYEQTPVLKVQKNNNLLSQTSATQHATSDLSKMSIAEKVIYYKKQKQIASQDSTNHKNSLIVKDSSTTNVSQNDLSKSSHNDSNIQIKTEMINKHRMKIVSSQQVQVQGNSDDDLQKLARQKIAMIQKERHNTSNTKNNSMQIGGRANHSVNSGNGEKYLKGLDQNSREQMVQQRNQEHSRQMNNKIEQAKLKAKNILKRFMDKN